jgi:hypothetical protein
VTNFKRRLYFIHRRIEAERAYRSIADVNGKRTPDDRRAFARSGEEPQERHRY